MMSQGAATADMAVVQVEQPGIPPDLIKVSDAAKLAKKSIGFIYLNIRTGHLRGFKSGRYTYVSKAEVEELLKPKPLVFVPYESRPRKSPAAKSPKAAARPAKSAGGKGR